MNNPVLNSLNTEMRCGVFTNAHGHVVIIHDKEISQNLQWLEFDQNENEIHLVYSDGQIQKLGVRCNENMQAHIAQADTVQLNLIQNKNLIEQKSLNLIKNIQ